MKKNITAAKNQIITFIFNPFWRSWGVVVILALSLALNGLVWYTYYQVIHHSLGFTPILYSSGVLLLNLFLANIIYRKEPLASFILMGLSLIIQAFIYIFMRITFLMSGF